MKRLLAIDPGPVQSAYVIIEDGKIKHKGITDNYILLEMIIGEDEDMVIEMIASYGMPVGKETFETCVWIGRFLQRGVQFRDYRRKEPDLVYRKDIKLWLCGATRAKDSNVRQALIDRYGKPGTKKNPNPNYNDAEVRMAGDMWAALAVATYWIESNEGKLE